MDIIDSLDYPVLTAIQYFTGVMDTFAGIIQKTGMAFGLLGLGWSAFKLINSRINVKELWWDTLYKWLLFILLLSFWKPFANGVGKVANYIGSTSASKNISVEAELKDFKGNIEELSQLETLASKDKLMRNINKLKGLSEKVQPFDPHYMSAEQYDEQLRQAILSSNEDQKKKEKLLQEIRSENEKLSNSSSLKTVKAIKEMTTGKNGTSDYVANSMYLKDSSGFGFLSSAAIFRFGLLVTQVVWLRNDLNLQEDYNSIPDEDYEGMFGSLNVSVKKAWMWVQRLPEYLMCFVLCFGIILASIFTIIQYMMTCIEFVIITAITVFFIPMVLLDVTKELPKKFIPVYISLFTKLLVMTLCMFYVMWSYLNLCSIILGSGGGMNWYNVGCILLQVIIGFILTQNAPKIAQTITTGQAQLSMGEFVAGVGTAIGAGKIAGKVKNAAAGKIKQTKEKVGNKIASGQARTRAYNNVMQSKGYTSGKPQNMSKAETKEYNAANREAKKAGRYAAYSTRDERGVHSKLLNTQKTAELASTYVAKPQPKDKGKTQDEADKDLLKYNSKNSPDA